MQLKKGFHLSCMSLVLKDLFPLEIIVVVICMKIFFFYFIFFLYILILKLLILLKFVILVPNIYICVIIEAVLNL